MKMKRYDIYPWLDGATIEKNRLYIKPRKGHIEYAAINPKGKNVTGLLSEKEIGFPLSENMKMDDLKPLQRKIMKAAAKKGAVYDPVLFFIFPFATSGDRAAVPNDPQMDSTMSYAEGYTPPYEGNYPADSAADPILRTQMNQVFYDVTNAIQQYQINGFPEFITSADNEGTPFPYDVNSVVRFDPGGGVQLYISLIDGNTDTPPSANWGSFSSVLAAEVSRNLSSQLLAVATQIVRFDSISYDDSGLWDGVNHQFNLPFIGYYSFKTMITPALRPLAATSSCQIGLAINGINAQGLDFSTIPSGQYGSWGGTCTLLMIAPGTASLLAKIFDTAVDIGASGEGYLNYFSVSYLGSQI